MNEPSLEIFTYRVYEARPGAAGTWVMSDFKATREAIELLGGEIVEGTGESAPVSAISADGRYLGPRRT